MDIKIDNLTGNQIISLIAEHLDGMAINSPPESIHALNLDGLKEPSITFWSVWEGEELLGCGALKKLADDHGELKSMRTSNKHLRKGVAQRMLTHIINEAALRGFQRLSLETGSMEAFLPARKLYERNGFIYCGPFSEYQADPNSVFMTKLLT
ncbi:GNAT family N-acetyltransferase [Cytobacillus purgationiresistens]|uniref:Acetyltransferase n=1 Tax=Cytobacillus purgationiresistens TaxID=863449 RepID=A0ABU0AFK8_9BACI|nr:GNAT family N-acetyltransferase [Cytobacillus purgationiresistens]MDQ0269805.1 putative acetyltransferase [Cytobacillus purgationiresistens]